ncbi:hypothetical protein AiwAL_12480 [Acidiphilium sp. AL]|uniref:Uncharacterized protein n=1 Tax=Acidiphilium iwatense TaxID=768198 RepID=A0ABS9E1Z6_9PROT|nr:MULTISPECIES: hypothetical protein [Acidiphilium]MCF3947667.1 hypothetical protein [Acidiphilium iwatense]MCU4160917.1 hypothetical protein [Acidiphilium sp. AL]
MSGLTWSCCKSQMCRGFKDQTKRGSWHDALGSIIIHEGQPYLVFCKFHPFGRFEMGGLGDDFCKDIKEFFELDGERAVLSGAVRK